MGWYGLSDNAMEMDPAPFLPALPALGMIERLLGVV